MPSFRSWAVSEKPPGYSFRATRCRNRPGRSSTSKTKRTLSARGTTSIATGSLSESIDLASAPANAAASSSDQRSCSSFRGIKRQIQ